jgi:hypothetical protein
VTVTGLGGTGKTQLVLHYIEEHKTAYDAVFWIDAQNEETARSSFARCCQQLNLSTPGHTDQKALRDSPFVHMFFHWLVCRGDGQEWLVVVDNADDLTWDVHALIPKGRMGTVIITSHDRDASTLLDGKSETINVDAMTHYESVSLLLKAADYSDHTWSLAPPYVPLINLLAGRRIPPTCVPALMGELDHLPLAIDLAGRRIAKTQKEFGSFGTQTGFENAVRNYTSDLRLHRRELLGGAGLPWTPSYRKTIWTVWESSLVSLEKFERYHPAQLLSLMARLNGTCIETELFRQASSSFREACKQLDIETPSWLGGMLMLHEDGTWDDFVYRGAVNALQRFGLVRSIQDPFPGVKIHGLVRWRVAEQATTSEDWTWFLVFVVAVLLPWDEGYDFSATHMLTNLPPTTDLIKRNTCFSEKGITEAWMSISDFLEKHDKWEDCESLHEAALSLHLSSLGDRHTTTASSKMRLNKFRVRREKSERAIVWSHRQRGKEGTTEGFGRRTGWPDREAGTNERSEVQHSRGSWSNSRGLTDRHTWEPDECEEDNWEDEPPRVHDSKKKVQKLRPRFGYGYTKSK